MGCFVVAEFLLTSASRSPSAIAEPLVKNGGLTDWSFQLICCAWIVRYLREKLSVLCYVGCGGGVLPPIVGG